MHCEICGREISWGYLVEIEGARLVACAECAERGVIIRRISDRPRDKKAPRRREEGTGEKEFVLVQDYGRRIRSARQGSGMTLEELAKKLHVREGYLRKIEDEELVPTDDLARRLEKILGVQLFEEVEEEEEMFEPQGDSPGLTLGDVVKLTWRRRE